MSRTQGGGGASLAKLYDLEGGKIAPGADLNDGDISLVHELGGQIFSENFRVTRRLITTAATNQSSNFDQQATGLPDIYKLLGCVVQFSTAGGAPGTGVIDHVSVHFEQVDASAIASIPFWAWDVNAGGTEMSLRFSTGTSDGVLLPGAACAALWPQRSIIARGTEAITGSNFSRIGVHGATTAFGAGTATVFVHLLIGFFANPQPGALAPIPSW